MFYVYILKCNDQSYYIGHTNNIDMRIAQHCNKECKYTSLRLPIKLVFSEVFETRQEAFILERKLKGWSRKKKEALIAQNWKNLQLLAKKKRFK